MAADAKRVGVVSAFGSIDGKLFYGPNHLEIATQAFDQGHISPLDLPTPENMGPMAFGWIWNNSDGTEEAEFYSDFLQGDQDFQIFDEVFKQLQKKFPKLTEMTLGPDATTVKEMTGVMDSDAKGHHWDSYRELEQ